MTIKERFAQARALIMEKRFAEARALLQQLDHPKAAEWLANLDQVEAAEVQKAPAQAAKSSAPSAATAPAPADHASPTPAATAATDDTPAPAATSRDRMDTGKVKTLLQHTKELIAAKKYDEARVILSKINHPTVQKWLEKLNQIAPPGAPPPTATPVEPAPRAEQEKQLIQAQELILASEFGAAKELLETLTLPEAETWRDKTQMNKFSEFQSLWLDMYTYGINLGDKAPTEIDAWRCPTCKRAAKQVGQCPQRGTPPCPAKIVERAVEEPHRIALVLGAIHMGDTGNIKTMLKTADAKKINHWLALLQHNLAQMWERDVRRPAYETALMLLGQLAESRKLQGMTGDEPAQTGLSPVQPLDSAPQDKSKNSRRKSRRGLGRLFGGGKEE